MAPPVKTRSSYRQQQAAATRDRIADAARRLFGTAGYGSISMEAIATEAGVAVRTVYSAFGTKREILSLICERWLEHAHARERAQEVFAEPDPVRRPRGAGGPGPVRRRLLAPAPVRVRARASVRRSARGSPVSCRTPSTPCARPLPPRWRWLPCWSSRNRRYRRAVGPRPRSDHGWPRPAAADSSTGS